MVWLTFYVTWGLTRILNCRFCPNDEWTLPKSFNCTNNDCPVVEAILDYAKDNLVMFNIFIKVSEIGFLDNITFHPSCGYNDSIYKCYQDIEWSSLSSRILMQRDSWKMRRSPKLHTLPTPVVYWVSVWASLWCLLLKYCITVFLVCFPQFVEGARRIPR